MVNASGDVHRCGYEILYLSRAITVLLEKDREFNHRVQIVAGMCGDEVGDEVLLFAGLLRFLAKLFGKRFEVRQLRAFHDVERGGVRVFRRDFEVPADVVGRQLFDVLG